MSRSHRNRTGKKNASTQTSDTESSIEIARLQEEVNILRLENAVLRKHMIDKTSSDLRVMQPEATLYNRELTVKHDILDNKSKKLQDDQRLQKSASRTGIRGCSCKGNCSTKICGCVKKELTCGQSCRCDNNICQNQIQKDMQTNVSEIINNHFENIHKSERLFSPDVTIDKLQCNLDELSIEPLQFESVKKLTFESDDEQTENTNVNKGTIKKQAQHGKGKLEKHTLKITETVYRKGKAISNEELRSNTQRDLKGTLRRHKSTEIAHKNNTNQLSQKNINYYTNIKRGMLPLRRGHKQKLANRKKPDSHLEGKLSKFNLGDTPGPIVTQRSNSSERNNAIESNDTSFDPMKPTRQLTRTPISGDTSNLQNVSTISLPTVVCHPIVNEEKEDNGIPAEFLQPEVDWEEYQSQLVACPKCQRRFHPLRITKHTSCCKNL